ncbi:MAG: hypothetical protein QOE93_2256 [Actinomycetota bacterium]|nr:hypothetical protein [Actinomycetota bacterium]
MTGRRRLTLVLLVAAGAWVTTATPAWAHGLGGRSDLPLPVWMFAYGAAGAIIVSFAALAAFWPVPRLQDGVAGIEVLGANRARLSSGLGTAGRVVGLVLYVVVLLAALLGPAEAQDNLAPAAIYIAFWVGLMFVSGLVGDLWAVISPFPTLAAGVDRLRGRPAQQPYLLGHWPAVGLLFAFVWMELAYPDRADPRQLAVAIIIYTAVVLTGAARWGQPFLVQGEAFAAFFGLLAAMAPVYADDDGRLRLRPPLAGLATMEVVPGTVAMIVVALGSTTFDGLSRTRLWVDRVASLTKWPLMIVLTFGLLVTIFLVGAAYVIAMRVAASRTGRELHQLTHLFAHTLVPIVFAYGVAHYFSYLLFEGQAVLALISDPFGRGWDLFGSADRVINYRVVSSRVVSWVQVGAIVAGHVAGVVLAHDRALATFPAKDATRSQYPLLAAMVLFTVGGLTLLLST